MLRLAHGGVVQPFILLGQLLWLIECLLNLASCYCHIKGQSCNTNFVLCISQFSMPEEAQ